MRFFYAAYYVIIYTVLNAQSFAYHRVRRTINKNKELIMAEVKNIVPSFEEFEKSPEKYMGELNAQPAVDAAQPAAQPGQTDSILGAQVGQATEQIPAAAQPVAETPAAQPAPAEGVQPAAQPAQAAQPAPTGGLV